MAISQRLVLAISLCFFSIIFSATVHVEAFRGKIRYFPLSPEPIRTVHDLLPQFGLPKGLIPDVVKSYSLSDSGDFKIELEHPCYVQFDNLVYYEKKITGKLKYGKIYDLSGIQAQKLFLWVPVSGIEVDSSSGLIEFHVGFFSEKLPAEQFQTIPKCRSNACRENYPEAAILIPAV